MQFERESAERNGSFLAPLILAFFSQEQLSILELELGQAREEQEYFHDLVQALSNENEKLKGRDSGCGQIQLLF